MATASNKRSSRAKSTAKPAETKAEQPSVDEPKAAPQSAAESQAGESAATPATNAGEASAITTSQEGEKINTPVQDEHDTGATAAAAHPVRPIESAAPGDSQDAAPSEQAAVTGDGSGEALPPIDPDAGERTAEGTSELPPPITEMLGDADDSSAQEEIPALFIRTRKPILRRRRCGHVFTPEGHGIALSGLTAEQISAFESDPTLIVEECSFPAKPDEDE